MLDKTKHVAGRRMPYLRNINVRWGAIETDDLLEMYFEDNELERYSLNAGDVRQVGEVQLGRQRAPQHHTGDNMRPYLRVANVFEARIDTSDVQEMNFTPTEFERYRLHYGDILLNEGQTPELVGRPAIFRDEIAECCYQKTLLRFRAYNAVLPHFALAVFRGYMHNRRFTRAASITTNIAHLTAEKFVEIEFPLPPLAEQTRIVAEVERRLSLVEGLEAVVSANLQRATRLRQSILKRAFEGMLIP
jgi:type I restriction enzyme S subunit